MLPFFCTRVEIMQNDSFHTPFAGIRESLEEKAQQEELSNIRSTVPRPPKAKNAATRAHADTCSKARPFAKSYALPSDEEHLFLRAVQHIKPSKKKKKKDAQSFFTLAAHFEKGGISLSSFNGDSQKAKSKSPSKVHASSLPEKKKTAIVAPVHEDISMQALLASQRPGFMGRDTAESQSKDSEAFSKAMQDVLPLQGKGRDVIPWIGPSMTPEQRQECFASMMEKSFEFSLSLKGEYLEGYVVGIDELTMNNLRRGVYSPEAHFDLHGLNAMQAYTALVGFFKTAWFKGLRTVLLVPGRGKNSPNGFGVLRDKLQLWLTQEPFKRVVLAFCTAQPTDGGAGTMYVLLRKQKKKGKINWERMPADPDLY